MEVLAIVGTEDWKINRPIYDALINKSYITIHKNTFGSTGDVDMIDGLCRLRNHRTPEEIVVMGFCTDIYVMLNACLFKTYFPETRIIVRGDLCAGTSEEKHKAALAVMESCQFEVKYGDD